MASNYPNQIDSFVNPTKDDSLLEVPHWEQHANANDAITAIQTELGTNPSGAKASVAARLGDLEAATPDDATPNAKGIVRLAGDLGGTADSPTVPGLAGKVDSTDSRLTDARTPTAHTHDANDIDSGTLDITRIPRGTTASTVATGNRGLPAGGTEGQVLSKAGSGDYAVEWAESQGGTPEWIDADMTANPEIPSDEAEATGNFSLAIGRGAWAEGIGSVAMGLQAHAEGDSSVAMGFQAHAKEGFSVAMGLQARAKEDSSFAMGLQAHAEGIGSVAMGTLAHAEGVQSFAMGDRARAKEDFSVAMGPLARAEGDSSVAMGLQAHAEGIGSVAMGFQAHADKNNSVAIGDRDLDIQGASRGIYMRDSNSDEYHVKLQDGGFFEIARATPGTVFNIIRDGNNWKYGGSNVTSRPSARTDIHFHAIGGDEPPSWLINGDLWTGEA